MAALGVVILLVQPPADALHASALHLALDVARVDGLAGILCNRESQYVHLAGFRVYLDIDQVGRKGPAHAWRIDRAPPDDGAARLVQLGRQFTKGHAQLRIGL